MASGEAITPLSGGKIEMHLQRHDAHEQGHLTPEGQEHARLVADEKVRAYLDKNPDTHFMLVASDQVFDDDEPDFGGVRARETAAIIADAIKDELAKRGLPAEQLFGLEDKDPSTATEADVVTTSPVIREAGIFSNKFMNHLRATFPDEDAWMMYYQDAEADQRKKLNAESSSELAQRMDYMIKTTEMVGASFHRTPGKEDKPLLVWMVGHGGGLAAYLHEYAGVPLSDLEPGLELSGGFSIRADAEGDVVAVLRGKEYPIVTSEGLELPK